MTDTKVMEYGINAIIIAIKVASPALISIMLTGVLVSVLQAATQINEQTLSFIPKILAMTVALIVSGPWIMRTIIFFTSEIFNSIPQVTH